MLPGADRWGAFYESGAGNQFPDENLVRLIKGKYANVPTSGRALDIGFGRGANVIMLAQTGFEAYGLEVSQESIDAANELAEHVGIDLRVGLLSGVELPYDDSFFDLVVSWNAIYYHGNRPRVADAIVEIRRVLKPGGVLLMSVVHPNSIIPGRLSEDTGDGAHRFDRTSPHDNRFGIDIYYEATSTGWRKLLSGFDEVEEGYAESDLFVPERRAAWRLFYARKGNPQV